MKLLEQVFLLSRNISINFVINSRANTVLELPYRKAEPCCFLSTKNTHTNLSVSFENKVLRVVNNITRGKILNLKPSAIEETEISISRKNFRSLY